MALPDGTVLTVLFLREFCLPSDGVVLTVVFMFALRNMHFLYSTQICSYLFCIFSIVRILEFAYAWRHAMAYFASGTCILSFLLVFQMQLRVPWNLLRLCVHLVVIEPGATTNIYMCRNWCAWRYLYICWHILAPSTIHFNSSAWLSSRHAGKCAPKQKNGPRAHGLKKPWTCLLYTSDAADE